MAPKVENEYDKHMRDLIADFFKAECSAIITVQNWTMATNGDSYLYFFCRKWKLLTDSQWPLKNFRSSERWQLLALNESGTIEAIFPGCQVKGIIRVSHCPRDRQCYDFSNGR